MWIAAAMLSVLALFILAFVSVGLWRLDPAILRETRVLVTHICVALVALGAAFYARHGIKKRNVVLSADALGVWVGIWGHRVAWSQIEKVTLAPLKRYLTIHLHAQNETALGKRIESKITRQMIDLHWIDRTADDVIIGLSSAAFLAGYTMKPCEDGTVTEWAVSQETHQV